MSRVEELIANGLVGVLAKMSYAVAIHLTGHVVNSKVKIGQIYNGFIILSIDLISTQCY